MVTNWTTSRLVILAAGLFCLGSFSLLPILLLESLDDRTGVGAGMHSSHVSVHSLLDIAHRLGTNQEQPQQQQHTAATSAAVSPATPATTPSSTTASSETAATVIKKRPIPSLHELEPDIGFEKKPVARGVAGLPLEQTPAMQGAVRAHIDCPELSVDSLAYWNNPLGNRDEGFQSPFRVPDEVAAERYISFSPDRGGT